MSTGVFAPDRVSYAFEFIKAMKKLIAIFAVAAISALTMTCSEKPELPAPDFRRAAGPEETLQGEPVETAAADTLPAVPPKRIYLTIDDSPLHGSPKIDSIITATEVKTNLFVVGKPVDESGRFRRHYERFRANPYVEIYNHSYSHANNRYAAYYKDPEAVLVDFEQNRVDRDIAHKIARLPGRNLWQLGTKTKNYKQSGATSAALLSENGYKVFGWDVEWEYDHKDYTPKQTIDELVGEIDSLYRRQLTFTKNHVVLLMHDQMFASIGEENDLGDLVGRLRGRGYTFEYLTQYPE